MSNFPKDFLWGTATSSYQIEGAHKTDGKGPSIWDAFCQIPGKIANEDTGEVACDHYHKIEEDVLLMKNMHVKAYRFSIAWSRILPDGTTSNINEKGIQFYNKLINTLIKHDIEPWVTLYHWDLPLNLHMSYDGWIDGSISDFFAAYADICFKNFGDRVKNWITINEPWVVAILGYGQGVFAPGRISNVEPYKAGHNLIIAHAKAVNIYRDSYQTVQGGKIGITNNCDWREPATEAPQDIEASTRALEFFLAWFADPIYLGDYPESMKNRLGDRLPTFTQEEIKLIKGSSDFFGLNHYTTMYASEADPQDTNSQIYGNGGLSEDQDVTLSVDPEWPLTSMQWAIVPWGCQKLLEWISDRYGNPPIFITENGCSFEEEEFQDIIADHKRIDFFDGYLSACLKAINNGVNLQGYFIWSLMDNFEWASGYDRRFGIHHVDFNTLKRTPKASAIWYANYITQNS